MGFEKLKAELEGQIYTDEETLVEVQRDFGRLAAGIPAAIVVPASAKDVCRVMKMSAAEGWPVTTRGTGHSQSGQSLSTGGLLIDMTGLNRIERVGHHAAWVQAGTLWSEFVRLSLEENLLPPVLTGYLDVTVAGTLSTGGLGASSYKLGHQALHVEELEVVTGEGHLVRCSQDENEELFNCTRAGLGQFSIITKAKVRLRRCAPQVRTFFLIYDGLSSLTRDLELITGAERFDYLECFAVPCPLGYRSFGETKVQFAEWFYVLQVSVEYGAQPPLDDSLLDGLRYYRRAHTEDSTALSFVTRHDPLFSSWKETGTWSFSHPWMETVLPWEKAGPYIQGILRSFPPHLLGGGTVSLVPLLTSKSRLPLLKLPECERVLHFGILPAVPRQYLPLVLPMLMKASELSVEMGGKRYLSGWVSFDREQWKAHFGNTWDDLLRWKSFYDPHGSLNSGFIRFKDAPE